MKLNIADRINLINIFPAESGMVQQILVKDIAKKVEFTQDEIKEVNLVQKDGMITWTPEKAKDKEVEFTEMELNFLRECVDTLDKNKKISQQLIDLCLLIKNEK